MDEYRELDTIRGTVARAKAEGFYVSEGALRAWVKDGKLPYVPRGNRKLIFWPALMEFIQTGEKRDNTPRPRFGPGSRGGKRR